MAIEISFTAGLESRNSYVSIGRCPPLFSLPRDLSKLSKENDFAYKLLIRTAGICRKAPLRRILPHRGCFHSQRRFLQ